MTVLNRWGVRTTRDFGEIVFAMLEAGLLGKTPDDKIEDFDNIYDFDRVFRAPYRPRRSRPPRKKPDPQASPRPARRAAKTAPYSSSSGSCAS